MESRTQLPEAARDPAGPVLLRVQQVSRAFVTPAETVHAVREVAFAARLASSSASSSLADRAKPPCST